MITISKQQAIDEGYHLQMTNAVHIIDEEKIMKSIETNLGPIGCAWVKFPKQPYHLYAYSKRNARPIDPRSVKLQQS